MQKKGAPTILVRMEQTFNITPSAAKRIAYLLTQEPPNTRMRVAVDGGGCSGFKYNFDFVQGQAHDDLLITQNGAEVLIDQVSLDFLKDATLDFVETLGGSHFEFKNPQAASTCGCGNSFSV